MLFGVLRWGHLEIPQVSVIAFCVVSKLNVEYYLYNTEINFAGGLDYQVSFCSSAVLKQKQ